MNFESVDLANIGTSIAFLEAGGAFLITLATFIVALVLYCSLTPHSEVKLIRAGNKAAGLSFSIACFAIAIPLAAAVHDSHHMLDIALWGSNAALFQLLAYFAFSRFLPEVNKAIETDEPIKTLPLCAMQLSIALLNAAIFAG